MTVIFARAHLSSINALQRLIRERLNTLDTSNEPQGNEWNAFFQEIGIATPGGLAMVQFAAEIDSSKVKFLEKLADQIAAYNTFVNRKRDERSRQWHVLRGELTAELTWLTQSASEASARIKEMRQPGWFSGFQK